MKITNILINQMYHPIGFDLGSLRITFEVTGVQNKNNSIAYKGLTIYKEGLEKPLYNISKQKYENNSFQVDIFLEPRSKYLVTVYFEMNKQKVFGIWQNVV